MKRKSMSPEPPSHDQAEALRHFGNIWFKKAKIDFAILAYTEAIALCPNVVVYWTNRALCHRRRNDWTNVESDCRKAIQLDHSSVKAHYLLGLALVEKKEYSEGVRELEKALDLVRGADPNGYMVEEIWRVIANAKYLEWEQKASENLCELLIVRDNIKMTLREQLVFDPFEKDGVMDPVSISDARELEVLEQVFRKATEEYIATEVPDYLCCKITLDILRDPVITPSGVTYERAVILHHLEKKSSAHVAVLYRYSMKVGNFDPVTREPLSPSQLVPNLAIKEAVRAYLEKHGWAYRMD